MDEKEREQLKQKYLEQLGRVTENRSEQLIKEIEFAFADVSYSKDEYISGSAEHNKECDEHRESHKFFEGKTWQEVLDEKSYRKLCGGQSYFNLWAWHYYLPAYLIQCIHHKYFSSFNFKASYESDVEEGDWQKERADLMTSKQCRVIIDYLEMTLEVWQRIEKGYEDDLKSLSYWKNNYQKASVREQNLSK